MKRYAGSWAARDFLAHRGLIALSAGAAIAGAALTSASAYGLSSSQYRDMFLPQAISFGQERLVSMSAVMAALIIAFGVGPLRRAGLALPDLYGASAVVAVALGLLSLAVAHRRPSPRSVRPRPQPMTASQPDPEPVS
jgi:hypothetical protein